MSLALQNQIFILSGLFITAVIIIFIFYSKLNKKIKIIFGGKNSTDGTIQQDLLRRLTKTEIALETLEPRLEVVEAISKMSIQKVGFTRFNPFSNTGGDNSFIIAMLDRENSGVLISSMYTREGVRVYAKHVDRGNSKHPLSDEEKDILEDTIKKDFKIDARS